MRAEVLGKVRLRGGDDLELPTGNVGRLLQLLLVRPEASHQAVDLCAELWPELPFTDRAARRRLEVTVSRLRRFLAPDPGWAVLAAQGGYRLRIPEGGLDRAEFERLGRAALDADDPSAAQAALQLWRGKPYEGFPTSPALRTEVGALETLHRRLVSQAVTEDAGEHLLRSKTRPGIAVGTLLRRAAASSAPKVGAGTLVTVVAPAGYGKSTFLAQWADLQRRPVAWLNLDDGDDDPARFWSGVARALQEALGEAASGVDDAQPGSTPMLTALAGAAAPDGGPFGVVLDDLHHVTNPRTLADVQRFLGSLPATCTVAVAARREPPVTLVGSGARRATYHVSAGDLAFSTEETLTLVDGDADRAGRLLELTGGWPVAVVTLQRAGADLADAGPFVERYIEDEVLGRLPKKVRAFVLEVAHLDAFTIGLCDHVTGRGDAAEHLAWLRDRGLFVVDTDPETGEGWCRFHPLIGAVARRRAAATVDAPLLWRRATSWFIEHGSPETALEYAVRARDRPAIRAVSGDVLLDAALRGQAHRCVQWLERIDPEDLVDDPRAHGIGVYLATEWMDREDRAAWLRSRQRHFGGDDDVVGILVRAIEAMRGGRSSEAVQRSEEVVQRCLDGADPSIGELSPLVLGSAFSNLIRARVLQGATTPADSLFPTAVGLIRPHSSVLAAWVHSFWGFVAFVDGDLELATSLAEEFFQARLPKELGREVRRDNSMLGALLAAARTTDPDRLRLIAEGIEDLPPSLETRGQHTDAAIAHLVLAGTYARAGSDERAEPHRRRADALLRTFEDAPFLRRLGDRIEDVLHRDRGAGAVLPAEVLTARQQEVAAYLATDLSLEDIAAELFISYQTARTHVREIYRRLGVHSRHEAVAILAPPAGERRSSLP